jgi:hypothetical protein
MIWHDRVMTTDIRALLRGPGRLCGRDPPRPTRTGDGREPNAGEQPAMGSDSVSVFFDQIGSRILTIMPVSTSATATFPMMG